VSALPDGLRRQVEGLLHAGHSDLDIQRRTGVSRDTVRRYRRRLGLPGYRVTADSPACRHGHPFPENAAHYPNGWLYCLACSRTRGRTKAASSYIPAQPDEMAIERAVTGDPPDRLTPRERAAAIRRLHAQQLSAAAIADRVRCSSRTVHRVRSQLRVAA